MFRSISITGAAPGSKADGEETVIPLSRIGICEINYRFQSITQRSTLRSGYHATKFGLTNAPAVFMDLMNRVCKPTLDNIRNVPSVTVIDSQGFIGESCTRFEMNPIKRFGHPPKSATEIRSIFGLCSSLPKVHEAFLKDRQAIWTKLTQKMINV
ncbi:hypothetical protein Tco_1176531 [Tanacetum coccineum]|uniref:Uncharacterized protein n=1 Tax=Tanacetum coccineum TaxID=301880 RepID=A0ABQ5EFI6_9ASTR